MHGDIGLLNDKLVFCKYLGHGTWIKYAKLLQKFNSALLVVKLELFVFISSTEYVSRIFGCYEIRGKTDISIWNILLQIKWEMNFKIPIEHPQWDLTYGAMMSQKHYLRARWWFYEFVWSQSGWNILVKAFWSGSHQTKVDYSQKWRSRDTIF